MIKRNFDIIIVGTGVSECILADEITKRTNKKYFIRRKINLKRASFLESSLQYLQINNDNKWKKYVIIKGKTFIKF